LLAIVGEMMEDSDQITGAVMSPRRAQDRIAIWTKTTDEDVCKRIGAFWKKVLGADEAEKVSFVSHEAAKQSGRGNKVGYLSPTSIFSRLNHVFHSMVTIGHVRTLNMLTK
jgi:translation initiation factor 4E